MIILRIQNHPILGKISHRKQVTIFFKNTPITSYEGEPIAAALMAAGIHVFRRTSKNKEPRFIYCGIGRCNDCLMKVNGLPNTRTCITPVEDGMKIEEQ